MAPSAGTKGPQLDLVKCPKCPQYMCEPRLCKGTRRKSNKGRWYRVCLDNHIDDDTTCNGFKWASEIPNGPEGFTRDEKCTSPWCSGRARVPPSNDKCVFVFCKSCCILARKLIDAGVPCPVSNHNEAGQTQVERKENYGSYISPHYEQKLLQREAEQRQRDEANVRGRQVAAHQRRTLLITWWASVADEPYTIEAIPDGTYFHPWRNPTIKQLLALKEDSQWQVFSPTHRKWVSMTSTSPATDIAGIQHLHYRSNGVKTGDGMPQSHQTTGAVEVEKPHQIKRSASGSPPLPASPSKKRAHRPSPEVIEILSSDEEPSVPSSSQQATTFQYSRKKSKNWPVDYDTIAAGFARLNPVHESEKEPALSAVKVPDAFRLVFPKMEWSSTTYYTWLGIWKRAPTSLKQKFAGKNKTWKQFLEAWKSP